MSDYTQVNNYTAKDDLPPGTGGEKIVHGTEHDEELSAISVAVATKYDSTDLSDQSTATTGTSNTVLLTPLRFAQHEASRGVNAQAAFGQSWTAYIASVLLPAQFLSYATIIDNISLPSAGLYEFELVMPYTRGGSGTILAIAFTNFSVAPSAFCAAVDSQNSSGGFVVRRTVSTGTPIQISTTVSSDTEIIRGFIKVASASTFAIQMSYIVSGGTGQPTLDAATNIRVRQVA